MCQKDSAVSKGKQARASWQPDGTVRTSCKTSTSMRAAVNIQSIIYKCKRVDTRRAPPQSRNFLLDPICPAPRSAKLWAPSLSAAPALSFSSFSARAKSVVCVFVFLCVCVFVWLCGRVVLVVLRVCVFFSVSFPVWCEGRAKGTPHSLGNWQ